MKEKCNHIEELLRSNEYWVIGDQQLNHMREFSETYLLFKYPYKPKYCPECGERL